MSGLLALVLHAHLPFVRHPEHERFLEENWLHEAVTDSYLPLLQLMDGWTREALPWRLTITLTPTLCAMLGDPLLRFRSARYLAEREALAAHEVQRTILEPRLNDVAQFYQQRFSGLREFHRALGGDLVAAFARHQESGHLEILTCAATHALLPLLASHPPSLRGQLQTAREEHRRHFGREPLGIWLPECAYTPEIEPALAEAGLRWFVLETHGLMHADPPPRRGIFAPLLTPRGLAAFGRDPASARQVWSRHGGYPGDPRYRDFHTDLAHEADWDYVKPYLPNVEARVFTGLKYHRVTGTGPKEVYDRAAALDAVREHAEHFVAERRQQADAAAPQLGRPPLMVAPYDAELFGHWWFEGPEFLDAIVRRLSRSESPIQLVTPAGYLRAWPANQVSRPSTSSWGDGGHFAVWLNRKNAWMQPHIRAAQERMSGLVARHATAATPLAERALRQAARELLLAQSSDWPFIVHTGTSPGYARERFIRHITAFTQIHEGLMSGQIDETGLAALEARDNLFPEVQPRHWAPM
jgi:1,4-alpha-glucan branching enzyme